MRLNCVATLDSSLRAGDSFAPVDWLSGAFARYRAEGDDTSPIGLILVAVILLTGERVWCLGQRRNRGSGQQQQQAKAFRLVVRPGYSSALLA